MAEFVQNILEEFSSAFKFLREVNLLGPDEMKSWLERLRRNAYAVKKTVRRPSDYIKFGESLSELVTKLRKKCEDELFDMGDPSLQNSLKLFLSAARTQFVRCSDSFKAVEYFKNELEFLKSHELPLASTYVRMLRIHGDDPKLYEEAAKHFYHYGLDDDGRRYFQIAVRKFPENESLWLSFFQKEIENAVKWFNKEKREKQEDDMIERKEEIDPVLNYKLAEIVAVEGSKALKENGGEFLLKCLRVEHTEFIFKIIKDGDVKPEIKLIAKIMKKNRRVKRSNLIFFYTRAFKKKPTVYLANIILKTVEEKRDKMKEGNYKKMKSNVITTLFKKRKATLQHYDDYCTLNGRCPEDMLEEALKLDNGNVKFWRILIEQKLEKENNVSEIMNLADKALKVVSLSNSLPIWELLLKYAIEKLEVQDVEKLFKKAIIKTTGDLCAEIKCMKLDYLEEKYGIKSKEYQEESKKLLERPPTNFSLFSKVIRNLVELNVDNKEIISVFEKLVVRHGNTSYVAWVEYGRFLMDFKPLEVSNIYQRASVNLNKDVFELFAVHWDQMIRQEGDIESSEGE